MFAGAGSLGAGERASDLALIHVAAMGGRPRIEALQALRATGYVEAGGKRVRFTMLAARPDRVRIETQSGDRAVVQVSDGVSPPWEMDAGSQPPRFRLLPAAAAKAFAADAEFDDPLVAGAARGYSFEPGGRVEAGDRQLLRVLVTRNLVETFSLLLDPVTYLILMRVDLRTSPGGRRIQIVTRFDDFRPVEGVLLPHELTLVVDGKVTQQTRIERMEPNPVIPPGIFERPAAER